jgi:hypothetical protein
LLVGGVFFELAFVFVDPKRIPLDAENPSHL